MKAVPKSKSELVECIKLLIENNGFNYVVLTCGMCFGMWVFATNFDETEIKSLGTGLVAAGGVVGALKGIIKLLKG